MTDSTLTDTTTIIVKTLYTCKGNYHSLTTLISFILYFLCSPLLTPSLLGPFPDPDGLTVDFAGGRVILLFFHRETRDTVTVPAALAVAAAAGTAATAAAAVAAGSGKDWAWFKVLLTSKSTRAIGFRCF